jgi:hypothetical protein
MQEIKGSLFTKASSTSHLNSGSTSLRKSGRILDHQISPRITLLNLLASIRIPHGIGIQPCQPLRSSITQLPTHALSRWDTKNEHAVNLLHTSILRLGKEEVDDEEEHKRRNAKYKSVPVMDLVGDEGREKGDQEIEKPVRCSGDSKTSRAVSRRIDFSCDSPNKWTPSGSKRSDEDASESDENTTAGPGVGRVVSVDFEGSDEAVDEETDAHDGGTPHESLATTDHLDDEEDADDGCGDVNGAEDNRSDKGVLDASRAEDCCAIVEEEICTWRC